MGEKANSLALTSEAIPVVGTAGHIDHGKTSLIYALTGMDTDRLEEEKRRGISIDIGFAEMPLPGGKSISFVDVPGHERFVRNMLAGAAGMEAALLIVAANESVMPQTREHFEICRLLGLRQGWVVVTKCDLATADQIRKAKGDIARLVQGSFLAPAPVIEVSSQTGQGLDNLKQHLISLGGSQSQRDRRRMPRLPIDRSFSLKGFGTVVTGTLLSGCLCVGDSLELLPSRTKVRVRGIQVQHRTVKQALAGQRAAVNLAGVEKDAVERGHVLAAADMLAASRILDVQLEWLDPEHPPRPRELFAVHVGTDEVNGRVSLLGDGYARLRLGREVIAYPDDRFIVRRLSPGETVGGGVVIDAFTPRRLNRQKILGRLQLLSGSPLAKRLEILLEERSFPPTLGELIRLCGAARTEVEVALKSFRAKVVGPQENVATVIWLERKRRELVEWLREFHKTNPNAAGALLSRARTGMDSHLAAAITEGLGEVRIEGDLIALASHRAQWSRPQIAGRQKIESSFRNGGFQPPSLEETLAATGLDMKASRALLESLIKEQRLVRLPDGLIFHVDVIAHIRNSLAQQKGRRFSVVEFKGWINISRKFAIPLLEYLDQQRVTRRDGDMRIIL